MREVAVVVSGFVVRAFLAAVFVCTACFSAMASDEKPGTVSVNGTGVVSAAPDMAVISFGVVREAVTARDALDQNNEAMARVLSELESEGVEPKDMQTSGFSIQPRYVYPKRQSNGEQPAPQIVGYTVSNMLTLRIRELDRAGLVMDRVVSLGVNSGGNISFTNADTDTLYRVARAAAVKDAVAKAQTLVESAGVDLGRILEISEGVSGPRPVPLVQARSMAVQEDAGAVPIASGENEYRITVTISWEIDQ